MVLAFIDSTSPAKRQEVQAQVLFFHIWIDFLFRKDILFTDIHSSNLAGGGDAHIGIIHTVVDYLFIAMHLRTGRYMDIDNGFTFKYNLFRDKVYRRAYDVGIVYHLYEIFHVVAYSLLRNTLHSTIIANTQKDISAKPIQEGADRLIGIRFYTITAAFELHSRIFPNFK